MAIDEGIASLGRRSFHDCHLVKIYRRADRFGGFSLAAWLLDFVMIDGAWVLFLLFILFSDVQMQVLIEIWELGAF